MLQQYFQESFTDAFHIFRSASSLVLTLSGVVKDILLVIASVLLLGSTVTFTQMIGYSIALLGLVAFKTKKEVWDSYVARAKAIVGVR